MSSCSYLLLFLHRNDHWLFTWHTCCYGNNPPNPSSSSKGKWEALFSLARIEGYSSYTWKDFMLQEGIAQMNVRKRCRIEETIWKWKKLFRGVVGSLPLDYWSRGKTAVKNDYTGTRISVLWFYAWSFGSSCTACLLIMYQMDKQYSQNKWNHLESN